MFVSLWKDLLVDFILRPCQRQHSPVDVDTGEVGYLHLHNTTHWEETIKESNETRTSLISIESENANEFIVAAHSLCSVVSSYCCLTNDNQDQVLLLDLSLSLQTWNLSQVALWARVKLSRINAKHFLLWNLPNLGMSFHKIDGVSLALSS